MQYIYRFWEALQKQGLSFYNVIRVYGTVQKLMSVQITTLTFKFPLVGDLIISRSTSPTPRSILVSP